MRTFLALCASVGTTRRIAEAMEKKAPQLSDLGWKLAWVPPANLHVTLKFFGQIPPESLDAITMTLRQRLADLPPITLKIAGTGTFPSAGEGPPRVLWIGVDGGKALSALQQSIESDMEGLGFPRESRAYRPHITIARVLEAPASPSWSLEPSEFGEEKISELVVYESATSNRPHRVGVEYLARARVPFSKQASY
jgi:2'-5' RNA ligase